jgi:hypothetical protein
MNNITFPLKPQMRGPEVADLQAALWQLLERGVILRDDEGPRRRARRSAGIPRTGRDGQGSR